jgi:hypothetical protein
MSGVVIFVVVHSFRIMSWCPSHSGGSHEYAPAGVESLSSGYVQSLGGRDRTHCVHCGLASSHFSFRLRHIQHPVFVRLRAGRPSESTSAPELLLLLAELFAVFPFCPFFFGFLPSKSDPDEAEIPEAAGLKLFRTAFFICALRPGTLVTTDGR